MPLTFSFNKNFIGNASSTEREHLAANLLLCTNEFIVIARLFFRKDPQETKKLGINLASHCVGTA